MYHSAPISLPALEQQVACLRSHPHEQSSRSTVATRLFSSAVASLQSFQAKFVNANVTVRDMAANVLTSSIPIGTMAALLTAVEYFLSLASGISARATVHGIWLIGLHRGGEAELTGTPRLRRSLIRDITATLLGVWLVTGVALVESNLQTGVRTAKNSVNTTLCVNVYGQYMPRRTTMHKPPYRANIEPWIMSVSQQINCGDKGIATLGTGGLSDQFGVVQNMSAPVCSAQTVDVKGGEVVASIKVLRVAQMHLYPVYAKSEGFTLFPHDGSNIGKDIRQVRLPLEGHGPCGERGISGFATALQSHYETLFFHVDNMTKAVHERICSLHGTQAVVPLPDPLVDSCLGEDKNEVVLNSSCFRDGAKPDLLNRITLSNMSALFISEKTRDPSYVCLSTSVELEYVFIESKFIKRGNRLAIVGLPVLIPTVAKALDGYCERTIPPLGQAALVYSADAEWRNDDLANLPRKTRYYAYMMAVSSSMFPLHTLRGHEDPRVNGTCLLYPVAAVTEIPVDWRFGILLSGLCFVLLFVIVGFAMRMSFSGEVWDVGSSEWSLARLLGSNGNGGDERNVLVQVVPVEATNSPSQHSRSSKPTARGPSTSPHRHAGLRRRAVPLLDRQFEYRVRPVSEVQGSESGSDDDSLASTARP